MIKTSPAAMVEDLAGFGVGTLSQHARSLILRQSPSVAKGAIDHGTLGLKIVSQVLGHDGQEAYERDRLATWEHNAPMRRAAQAAAERANRRHAAELGVSGQPPIAACLEWTRPQCPEIW